MRKFCTLVARGQQKKLAEIAFLQQYPEITTSTAMNRVLPKSTENKILSTKPINTSKGIKKLMSLVHQRRYCEAEQLFSQVPRLIERPSAIRLLIKMYCEQTDFTSARALLLRYFKQVGDKGCANFIAHATFSARNSHLIKDVFGKRAGMHVLAGSIVDARLVSTTLNGLLFLNDMDAFDHVWTLTSQNFFNPNDNFLTCQCMVLKFLIEENWNSAVYWWQVSMNKKPENMHKFHAKPESIWFLACRYYVTEIPNTKNLEKIMALMVKFQIELSFQLTSMLLYHLPRMRPLQTALDWLHYARKLGWPINAQCIYMMMSTTWPRRFPNHIKNQLKDYTVDRLNTLGLSIERKSLAMGDNKSLSKWIKKIKQSKLDTEVSSILNTMQKQGIIIPYEICVLAFKALLSLAPANNISQIIDSMCILLRKLGYPLHCAGIDLSVVEVHCRATAFNHDICKRLISDYLVQYPLINSSLGDLTRLSTLLMKCEDYNAALRMIDSLRTYQPDESGNFRFSFLNHDSTSLQIMVDCKFRLGERVTPILLSVINDKPQIYFDDIFLRKVRRILKLTGEDGQILQRFCESNAELIDSAKKEIIEALNFVHNE